MKRKKDTHTDLDIAIVRISTYKLTHCTSTYNENVINFTIRNIYADCLCKNFSSNNIFWESENIYFKLQAKKHSKRISAKQRKKYNAQFFFSYLLIITRINERIYKYQHWIDKSQCKFELNYKHFCSLEWMTIEFLLA